jgi:hypothetical protein
VNPSVGRLLYSAANADKRDMTTASLESRRLRPWRRKMRSALLFSALGNRSRGEEVVELGNIAARRPKTGGSTVRYCIKYQCHYRAYWIIPAALGATLAKVCTCAITSWRLFFSSFAARLNWSSVSVSEIVGLHIV